MQQVEKDSGNAVTPVFNGDHNWFDIDAAILFSDILVVPHAMGLPVTFKDGEGPVLKRVLSDEDVKALAPLQRSTQVGAVCETVRRTRSPGTRAAGSQTNVTRVWPASPRARPNHGR